jgi:class 3 adenylate cyclase/tetratricopeptide (TPR) repeat protein
VLADAPALAARLGSEALYHVMQALLTLAHEVMEHYDGTLTHVTGEGFTALFGVPVAQEDHARRAVLAALLLHQRLDELPTLNALGRGSSLALRTGMHTGQVVVGPLLQAHHHCYIAEGPTAHLATLLQQRAAPGMILISAATLQLVLEDVQAAAAGTIAVAGIPIPMPVYAVQGLVPQRAGVVGHGTRHQSPFVGRERELALLRARLAQVVQGQGQMVGILGEAGMGKSRLLEEFRRSLTEQPVTYYVGHCLPYGQATPYLPIRDLLRQCCGLTETDGSATITSKVHQCLRETRLIPEDEAPWLLQLLDVPGTATHLAQCDPYTRKMRTFALLHHVILHACRHQPLILVVENLQWIDATSEAWLAALVERLAGVSLLLLASYRPGYRPPWLAQSLATQVALPGLLPQESLTVVHSVPGPAPLARRRRRRVQPFPRHLAQEIVTKAAGNPFFVEELAWSVATHDDRHTALTLPDTVQAVLAARIDRLTPATKQLLQLAAVIGTKVPVALLRASAEIPEEALHGGLAQLQATEFLYETRFFPEGEYAFKHALTHEVAYGSLLQERQRILHARVVEALERPAAERLTEQVDRLAHHALQGEMWDKALTYCRQAGARAVARSAYHEAAACFKQALTALAQLPERRDTLEQAIDLQLDLHRALMPLDAGAHTFELLRAAEAIAERLGDDRRLGRIAGYLCAYFSHVGEHDRTMTAGQRAFALATTSGVSDIQVWPQTPLGQAYYYGGDWRQALDYGKRTMVLLTGELRYASFGYLIGPAVSSRRIVAWSLAELGDFAAGRSVAEDALRIAEAVAQPYTMATALMSAGLVSRRQGDIHTAIPMLERSLALSQRAHVPRFFPLPASSLGAAYALAGRVAEALPLLDQALERVATGSRAVLEALVLTELSEALLLCGGVDEASRLAERLLELSRTHIGRGYHAHACRLLGDIAAHCNLPEVEEAQAYYRRPSPWPRNWACARSRRIATVASVCCMLRETCGSRPTPSYLPPSRCTGPWT